MRRCAVCNQKGGVGKTTTVTGLASALMTWGLKVLIVDMDPQANATSGLGVTVTPAMPTTYSLMAETLPGAAADAVVATEWDGVDLIPADEGLAAIESDGANDLIFRLDVALEGLDYSPYAAVLFDCPPSLGKLLYATLCASDGVIAVTEPGIRSVKGVQNLIATIDNVRLRPNPRITLDKIVISRKRGFVEHDLWEGELRREYGELVAKSYIPELAARQVADRAHIPIHHYRAGNALSLQVAYSDLLNELPFAPQGVHP